MVVRSSSTPSTPRRSVSREINPFRGALLFGFSYKRGRESKRRSIEVFPIKVFGPIVLRPFFKSKIRKNKIAMRVKEREREKSLCASLVSADAYLFFELYKWKSFDRNPIVGHNRVRKGLSLSLSPPSFSLS